MELSPDQIGDASHLSVGRGAAFGDLDNDGDVDVVIANNNSATNLLIRTGIPNGNWVGFSLEGVQSNQDAIGSRVMIETDGLKQIKYVSTAGSYLAANDKRLLFGLNSYPTVGKIIIDWPSGTSDEFTDLKANQYYRIVEGGNISAIHY